MYITDIEIPIPAHEKIKKHILAEGKTVTWLAGECEVCVTHLCQVLNGNRPLGKKLRAKANRMLGTSY